MKPAFYICMTLAVMFLAASAYKENYRTQSALREVERLQREIGHLRERRTILAAEWAWLNRPERLRDLVELNFDSLGLMPLLPDQFARIDEVPFPAPPVRHVPLPVELVDLGQTK